MPACVKSLLNISAVLSCLVLNATAANHATAAETLQRIDAAVAGTVPWHRDLAQAKTASLISHRPVLVIFTSASTDSGATFEKTVVSTPEAAALLTACFEPVRIDVEAEPSLARSMGVARLPAACVIDANDRLLAKFDCPDTPAAFVAAAGRAAQEAAAGRSPVAAEATTAIVQARSAFTKPVEEPPVAPTPPDQLTAATTAAAPAPEQQAAHEPTLPAAPPAWPAEPASKPMTGDVAAAQTATQQPPAVGGRAVLEPAPAGTAPWLGGNAHAATQSTKPAQEVADSAAPAAAKNPVSGFIAALQKPFAGFSKPAETKPAPGSSTTQTAAAPTAGADPYGSMPLGLEGYCPVTLIDKGSWVEGRAQWGARHRGRTYLFAGAEQQKAFLADPDRYAPALSGDDPVLALDAGKCTPGQRRYGVTYQSRTYLFSSSETRDAFAANPQRYTAGALVAENRTTTNAPVVR